MIVSMWSNCPTPALAALPWLHKLQSLLSQPLSGRTTKRQVLFALSLSVDHTIVVVLAVGLVNGTMRETPQSFIPTHGQAVACLNVTGLKLAEQTQLGHLKTSIDPNLRYNH